MVSTKINKISKSINCPDGQKLKFEDADFFGAVSCDKGKIGKNFSQQCDGRESCILDNSLLGCQGYDFDLNYSCYDADDISVQGSIDSSLSSAINDSKQYRMNEILSTHTELDSVNESYQENDSKESTYESSIIQNQQEETKTTEEDNQMLDQLEPEEPESEIILKRPITFWDRFKHWIIGAMIVLLLIAIVIAVTMFFRKESSMVGGDLTSQSSLHTDLMVTNNL